VVIDFKNKDLPPVESKFFGLIRDIDYTSGFKIVPQFGLDIS
jgi:hypothetical protein